MESNPRTQAERSETTRRALVDAARGLFATRGYAAVGTPEIVAAAGLTRGALYHQFADKSALFQAVLEQVEAEVMRQIAARLSTAGTADPLSALTDGADAWLDACAEPGIQQILLVDGPAVLGWNLWRQIGERYGLGLTIAALQSAMDAGAVRVQPVAPLAHVLVGALDEAALYVSRAEDPGRARQEVSAVLRQLVSALATRGWLPAGSRGSRPTSPTVSRDAGRPDG